MKTIILSLLLSVAAVGAVVLVGGKLWRGRGASPASGSSPSEIEVLRQEVESFRDEARELVQELRRLRASQQALVKSLSGSAGPNAGAPAVTEEADATAASPGEEPDPLAGAVAAVIAEERKQQETERQREREERRERQEQLRQEMEAMRQGPYDRYNMKVNSLAKALGLSESQKQSYFGLVSGYRTKLEEGMKQLREARKAEEGASAEGQRKGRGPDRGDGQKFRELNDALQQAYAADMSAILSPDQLSAYGGLSRSAQSFQDTDMVSASGRGESRLGQAAGFPGGGFGGGRTRGGARPGR